MPFGSIRGDLATEKVDGLPPVVRACLGARGALGDAVDLILIHNERPGGGDQPRAVLNPLVVMLAVSAWERLIYEVGTAIGYSLAERETVGRLGWWGRPAPAADILARATARNDSDFRLPGALVLTFFDSAVGKRLGSRVELEASKQYNAISGRLNDFVELRNGVAHRVLPDRMAAPDYQGMVSDAWSGRTVNTGIARCVLATYIQLLDQAIACLLVAEDIEGRDASRYRLPAWWFTDDQERDGARSAEPGCLWGGMRLPRRMT